MGKKTKTKSSNLKSSNLLYQRLKQALDLSLRVQIEVTGESYRGIPISLDREFVEILILLPPDRQGPEEPYKRVTWLIRLSSIVAIAYPTEYWTAKRLEGLLQPEEMASERDH